MLRQDVVTSNMTVTDIVVGDPTYLLLTQRATRPDGKARTLTQKVAVSDASLAACLLVQVHKGDEIEATVVTEWSKEGYATYLSAFVLLTFPLTQPVLQPSI